MKPGKVSWSRLGSRCLCGVPPVVDRDAIGIRCVCPAKAKAWSRPRTRSTCGYHHGCGRARWWRCLYTSWDSQCLCACAHPHHVVRSIVGGRFTRCKCRPAQHGEWRAGAWAWMAACGRPGQNQGEKAQKRNRGCDDNLGLSLLGSEEETDSDNRAFLYLYETTLPCVERQTGKRDDRHRRSGERLVDCHGSRLRAYQSPHLRYASRFIVRYLPMRIGSNPDFCTTASHGYRPRFLQAWSVAQSLHSNTMRHPERGSRNMSTW
jgi:hypothetical protein